MEKAFLKRVVQNDRGQKDHERVILFGDPVLGTKCYVCLVQIKIPIIENLFCHESNIPVSRLYKCMDFVTAEFFSRGKFDVNFLKQVLKKRDLTSSHFLRK